MTGSIDAMIDYAEAWDVPVLVEPDGSARHALLMATPAPGYWRFFDWQEAPGILIGSEDLETERSTWPYFLHELAHVASPVHPQVVDEDVDTLGFELLSIRHLGLPWRDWVNWQVLTRGRVRVGPTLFDDNYESWLKAPREWRSATVARAVAESIRVGLFDADRRPTFRIERLRSRERQAS